MTSIHSTDIIKRYFPEISPQQIEQFSQLENAYIDWNQKINVISRKDTDQLVERHILHGLAIAKYVSFKKDADILDIGTGGGIPGLPLAIFFPQTKFVLVDSIGKKIKVVNAIADELGLTNVKARHMRAEDVSGSFDFIVSRAVAPGEKLLAWTKGKLKNMNEHEMPNGHLWLKGGDLKEELSGIKLNKKMVDLKDYYQESFYDSKKLIHVYPNIKSGSNRT